MQKPSLYRMETYVYIIKEFSRCKRPGDYYAPSREKGLFLMLKLAKCLRERKCQNRKPLRAPQESALAEFLDFGELHAEKDHLGTALSALEKLSLQEGGTIFTDELDEMMDRLSK